MEWIGYLLFAVLGLGFGYALRGALAYLVLLLPPLMFVGAIAIDGFDAGALLELVVALVVTLAGILAGRWLAGREATPDPG